jgi:flagellar motor switch protein FliN/FliY
MTLPDEFLDAFAGTVTLEDPALAPAPEPVPAEAVPVEVPAPAAAAAPVPEQARRTAAPGTTFPPPPGPPTMGPEATDLPELDAPDLAELGTGTGPVGQRDLRLLADVEVELAVELGRVKLPLRDLLALGPGAVLELDRAADAPVDVLVNGCLVARGEVVVIDGEFGVRVTAVVER